MEPEPENEDPAIVGAIISSVIGILQLYGWFILIGIGAAYYLYRQIRPWYSQVSQQREFNQYKKIDTGGAQSRLEAMERARLKMQQELDAQAKEFAEKQKKKDEEKRKEKIEDWERHLQGKGYRSKTKAPEEKPTAPATLKPKAKKPLKPDYNPLMGDNGGACFRPTKRGGASGGGG
ncbi:unnamed protein product [Lymnaea stagnalis]|uniref:Selenoprotein S n=1 Tax=Lymnaea stagnalis TaxID=6523 RepID=A0AAV2I803_LYMST